MASHSLLPSLQGKGLRAFFTHRQLIAS